MSVFVTRISRGRLRQSIFSHSAQKISVWTHLDIVRAEPFFCRFFRFLRFLSSSSRSVNNHLHALLFFMTGPDIISSPVIASTFTAAVRARLPASPPAASAMLLYGFLILRPHRYRTGQPKCLSYIADIRGSDSWIRSAECGVLRSGPYFFSTAVTSFRLLRTS